MVTLNTLPKLVKKRKKRLGRGLGSGTGVKSTRGTTRHQKAREKIKIWFEGGQNRITKKFPLLRGKGRNKASSEKPVIISLTHLERLPADTKVDINTLLKYKIVNKEAKTKGVKLLSDGEVTKSLVINIPTSVKARAKIEKAGGKVI